MATKSQSERLDDERIMKLFRYRCVGNRSHQASVVHELITRARSKEATTMKNNRIPLCQYCHDLAHRGGYTLEKESMLRMKAERTLESFGVSLEEW